MKGLAQLILRGPMQASAIAATAALLSLLLPPLSLLSGAAVALVVLTHGSVAGLRVTATAAVAAFAIAALLFQGVSVGLAFAVVLLTVVWAPVIVVATSLRRTVSLSRAILLAGLFGAVVAVGFHFIQDDPTAWWADHLREVLAQSGRETSEEFSEALAAMARWMTAVLAASLSVSVVVSLLLARWWQAVLYNPGGFRQEFHELRLGRALAGATLALAIAAGLAQGQLGLFATDLLLLAALLHLLQGVAIVHGLVARTRASVGWLIGMYVLLGVMPQTGLTLALAGLADNWFDFRAFFGTKENR